MIFSVETVGMVVGCWLWWSAIVIHMIWTMKTPKLYIPIAICKLEGRKTKVNKCNNKSSTHNVATNKLVLDERK